MRCCDWTGKWNEKLMQESVRHELDTSGAVLSVRAGEVLSPAAADGSREVRAEIPSPRYTFAPFAAFARPASLQFPIPPPSSAALRPSHPTSDTPRYYLPTTHPLPDTPRGRIPTTHPIPDTPSARIRRPHPIPNTPCEYIPRPNLTPKTPCGCIPKPNLIPNTPCGRIRGPHLAPRPPADVFSGPIWLPIPPADTSAAPIWPRIPLPFAHNLLIFRPQHTFSRFRPVWAGMRPPAATGNHSKSGRTTDNRNSKT